MNKLILLFLTLSISVTWGIPSNAFDNELDVICLNDKGYMIDISQRPYYYMIIRESPKSPDTTRRIIVGDIIEYIWLKNAYAGLLSIESVDEEFIGDHEKDGYFLVDLDNGQVVSGLTKEEVIESLRTFYVKDGRELVFTKFELSNQDITKGEYGKYSCYNDKIHD